MFNVCMFIFPSCPTQHRTLHSPLSEMPTLLNVLHLIEIGTYRIYNNN